MMYAIQRRHRLHAASRQEIEEYVEAHGSLSRADYFAAPTPVLEGEAFGKQATTVHWPSPVKTAFPSNDRTHIDLYPGPDGWSAPTVFMLHALMSASDIGYRRWAADFNARGWNACFIHLPFHYSRTPPKHWQGELAITADAIRNAEGLRAGVAELRQLMALLRAQGGQEFGLWASSYGGWIGALLLSVEPGWRWAALMEPITDVGHAIWHSPTGLAVRRELRRSGVEPELLGKLYPLVGPGHAAPLVENERVIFCAGDYDHIARVEDIRKLHEQWRGSEMLRVAQGHFGYRMMPAVWGRLRGRALL
jgi:pimeloyl-ACP methyl ester carboxylesterase